MAADVFEVIRERRSVRRYLAKEVPDELVREIVDAATRAPSAGGLQSYHVVIVREPARRLELSLAAYDQDFLERAPVVLVFLADPDRANVEYGDRGADLFAVQDATIAAAYAQLASEALGLGSVWVGQFDEVRALRAVEAHPNHRPVALLAVGYAAEAPVPVPRRTSEVMVSSETFQGRDEPPPFADES